MKAILEMELELPGRCWQCQFCRVDREVSICLASPAFPKVLDKSIRAPFCPLKIVEMPEHTEIPKHNKLVMFPAMTLRDYFAAAVIPALAGKENNLCAQDDARIAYNVADAMLAAREGGAA